MSVQRFKADTFIFTTNSSSNVVNIATDPGKTLNFGGVGSLSTNLPSGQIFVGNESNQTSKVTVSGDISLTNTGVVSLANEVWPDSANVNIGSSTTTGSTNVNICSSDINVLRNTALSFTRNTCFSDYAMRSVCWHSGLQLFLAVGAQGAIANQDVLSSPNGVNWTLNTVLPVASGWASICYAPDIGVTVVVSGISFALGYNAVCYSSPNSYTSWSNTTLPASVHWSCVARSTGLVSDVFVAVSKGSNSSSNQNSSDTGSTSIGYSTNGSTWTLANAPHSIDWNSVCYSPSLKMFVAISSGTLLTAGSKCMTSLDGINWTSRDCITGRWTSVCWSEEVSRFTAVSNTNLTMYSNDGITWISSSAIASNNWSSVCWNDKLGIFVACASTGTTRIMYSLDGINWNAPILSVSGSWYSVCSSGSNFVGVALQGVANNSFVSGTVPDQNVTLNIGTVSNSDINMFGKSVDIQTALNVSGKTTLTSVLPSSSSTTGCLLTNGGVGINCNTDSTNSTNGGALTIAGGLSVAKKAYFGTDVNITENLKVNNTADATSTTSGSIQTLGGLSTVKNIYAGTGLYTDLASGITDTSILYPENTDLWIGGSENSGSTNIKLANTDDTTIRDSVLNFTFNSVANFDTHRDIVYHKALGVFLTISYNGNSGTDFIYDSTDGAIWNYNTLSRFHVFTWICVGEDNGITIVGGGQTFGSLYDQLTFSAYNSISFWTDATASSNQNWMACARGSNADVPLFVAVSAGLNTSRSATYLGSNVFMTSPIGSTWTGRTLPLTDNWSSICYSKRLKRYLVVALGISGSPTTQTCYSSDGITFTGGSCLSGIWQSVCYSEDLGLFVMVGNDGQIQTSLSGVSSWTMRTSGTTDHLWSVCYSEYLKMFIACSSQGTNRIFYSTNGFTWTGLATLISGWIKIAAGKSSIVAVSSTGTINNQIMYSRNLSAFNSDIQIGTLGTTSLTTTCVDTILNTQTLSSNGITTLTNTLPSTSTSDGSLVMSGGISIKNTINAVSETNGGSFTTAGGMAIGKNLFVGGSLNFMTTNSNFALASASYEASASQTSAAFGFVTLKVSTTPLFNNLTIISYNNTTGLFTNNSGLALKLMVFFTFRIPTAISEAVGYIYTSDRPTIEQWRQQTLGTGITSNIAMSVSGIITLTAGATFSCNIYTSASVSFSNSSGRTAIAFTLIP